MRILIKDEKAPGGSRMIDGYASSVGTVVLAVTLDSSDVDNGKDVIGYLQHVVFPRMVVPKPTAPEVAIDDGTSKFPTAEPPLKPVNELLVDISDFTSRVDAMRKYERPIVIELMDRMLTALRRVAKEKYICVYDKKSPESNFFCAVRDENLNARAKFPDNNAMNAALVEEVGEVSTALMYEPWDRVVKECVQVASMAMRIALEGDWTMKEFRLVHVHSSLDFRGQLTRLDRYLEDEHLMPGHGLAKCISCGTHFEGAESQCKACRFAAQGN